MNTYGVVNANGEHIDVSRSEKGAKQYATLHGYKKVSIRYNGGYTVAVIAVKINDRWIGTLDKVTKH